MFARQHGDRLNTGIQFGEALRIKIELVAIAVERVHGFVELDTRTFDQFHRLLERGIDIDQITYMVKGGIDDVQRCLFVAVEQGDGGFCAFDQPCCMAEATMFLIVVEPLLRIETQRFEFLHLPFEHLAFTHTGLGIALGALARGADFLPGTVGFGHIIRE